MRLAFRGTLLLLALYAVSVIGLFALVDRVLQDAAWATMEETAQAVGQEVVRALSEPLRQATLGPDQAARARLRELVQSYVETSPLVTHAAVVDTYGQVVSDPGAGGGTYPPPHEVFQADRRPRLVRTAGSTLRSGVFLLDVPVHEGDQPLGYIRLTLDSARLGWLFEAARRRLLAGAGLGLLVIGVAAFLLHARLAHRQRVLVETLNGILEGTANGGTLRDEEQAVRVAAARVKDAFRRERELGDAARHGISHVGRLLDVGVAVLGPDGSLEFIEPRARKLLGLPEGQTNGAWTQLLDRIRPALVRARAGASSALCDLEPREGRGSVRIDAIPTDEIGGGFVLLVRDRSAVQAVQTDLRMAAHLRNLTRIYLGVAHDLRAPVHAMGLNLALLREWLQRDDAGSARELRCLDVLERETARLKRGLELVLAQTAPSSKDRQTFDLRDVLSDVTDLLTPQARQQAVTVSLVLPPEPVNVVALRDAVAQAVCNLCINALEAMPEGGTLGLEVRSEGDRACVHVRDTGPGIPPEVRPRIFEMHVTTKASGTGIGLYVARSVAEADGGGLSLRETGPGGTHFELSLPRAAVAGPPRAQELLKEEVS